MVLATADLAVDSAATWDVTALLAGVSALLYGLVKLGTEYGKDASWSMARPIVARHRFRMGAVLLLEAVAGIATAGLVVLLGVTQPSWIDQPLGWVLVGLAAPAVVTASLGTIPIGKDGIEVGLSAVYLPLRRMLLGPVDVAFHHVGRAYKRAMEPIFRRRVEAAFDAGVLDVPAMIEALHAYADRSVRSDGDRETIEAQIRDLTSQSRPANLTPNAWERDKALQLNAFMVEKRYISVLEGLVGELTDEEAEAVKSPSPLPGAIG